MSLSVHQDAMLAPAPEASDVAIDMQEVVAISGDFPVLAGATVEIATGEIICLEGPNGAGKTSLLRVLAGVLPIYSGSANVFGYSVGSSHAQSMIGLLGHQNGLYRELTPQENLRFYARIGNVHKSEITTCLDVMKISSRVASTRVENLSAGQRRRTALAILLLQKPKVWLLDEPHAGLDADSRGIVDSVLMSSGATVVFSSHEQEHARSLATRVISLDGGIVAGEYLVENTGNMIRNAETFDV